MSNTSLVDAVAGPVAVFDAENKLLATNPDFRTLFGLTAAMVAAGPRIADLVAEAMCRGILAGDEKDESGYAMRLAAALTDNRGPNDVLFADGHVWSAYSCRLTGGGWLLMFDDTAVGTSSAEMDDEDERMAALARLSGGMAHEINNLMTVVRGNLELIEDAAGDTPMIGTWSRRAVDAVSRATNLAQHVLGFSGGRAHRPADFDLAHAAENVVSETLSSVDPMIAITLDLTEDLPEVSADPDHFDNALMALLDNASKAVSDGGRIKVAVTRDPVDAGFMNLYVEDDGVGMAPEVLKRACEPFFTTRPRGGGPGLGLSTAFGFARQSGGDLRIDSVPGEGTRVTIRLPVAESSQETDEELTPRGQGEVVLVVDDEDAVREIAADLLSSLGYRVVTAAGGDEALGVIADGTRVDLVFSDLVMPGGMDGEALANRIRADHPDIPVVLTTGFREPARSVEIQGFTVIAKPYRQKALSQVVRAALDGG